MGEPALHFADARQDVLVPYLTVNAVVLEGPRVLLTKREDFHVWCLPGGHVEPGESLLDAAVREAREETGHMIEVRGFVGIYSAVGDWPDMHACVFTGASEAVGPIATPEEVIDIEWFDVDRLPPDLIWWHRERLNDAVTGRTGLVVEQVIRSELGRLDRAALYAARDSSPLPRSSFFRQTFRCP